MALKGAFEREIRKIKKTALAAALKLGFKPGKGLMDAIYLEYEFWEGKPSSPTVNARHRCIEAFQVTLDPLYIRDTDAIDWIKQVDRSLAILRRDAGKAAPPPDDQAMRAFKRERKVANAASDVVRAQMSELLREREERGRGVSV
jgi:hypothetical protein